MTDKTPEQLAAEEWRYCNANYRDLQHDVSPSGYAKIENIVESAVLYGIQWERERQQTGECAKLATAIAELEDALRHASGAEPPTEN